MGRTGVLTDILVFVGPSGCGKSTLIKRLRQEFPQVFRFCTSHTTRRPRAGEVDGREYHFVTTEQFEGLIRTGGFVEHVRLNTSPSTAQATAAAAAAAPSSLTGKGAGELPAPDGNGPHADLVYYGTSKQALQAVLRAHHVVLMDTDVRGAINLRRYCERRLTPSSASSASSSPLSGEAPTQELRPMRCQVLFVAPPSMEALAQRLHARGSETSHSAQQRLRLGEQWMRWAEHNRGFFDYWVVNGDLDECYAEVRRIVLREVITMTPQL